MMSKDLDVISSQLKAIQSEVVELNVGVSHLALDEERERCTRIRERIEAIITDLGTKQTPDARLQLETCQRLLTVATGNTETLRYLESISCLENIFTDVTKAATITAIGLSTKESIPQRVLSSRFLTSNVKQCWDYTEQISTLTAIHLKAAVDFHLFNHEVNEICAHASQLKTLSEKQLEAFSPLGNIAEASNLCDEMTTRLNAFQSLADRAQSLTARAPSILPIENRLLKVSEGVAMDSQLSGPLMVQMMIDYVGRNFSVGKGESLQLIDTTKNPYLWKVMTTSGPQFVPSITCIMPPVNAERIQDAYRTLGTVNNAWSDSLENYRRQLVIYYSHFFESIQNYGGLQMTDLNGKRFLEDLDRLAKQSDTDEGRLTNILAKISGRRAQRTELTSDARSHSDTRLLHQPLQVINEHMQSLKKLTNNLESNLPNLRDYASTINLETHGLKSQLESLRMTYDRNRTELEELYGRVHNWKAAHDESIYGPTSGIGRLVISSNSSSSGFSSEELSPIPLPPSPFGTLQAMEIASIKKDGENKRSKSKMSVALLQAKDEVRTEKSTVFTCGANLNPVQLQANVNVKKTAVTRPRMVRDVAIQTHILRAIRNTQTEMTGTHANSKFASTQCEFSQVDCMTQIGSIKAQKAQQAGRSILLANMEAFEPTPSIGSATTGVVPDIVHKTCTTAPAKTTSAHHETETSSLRKRDLIFQVNDSRTARSCLNAKVNSKSSEFATDAESVDSAAIEAHVPTKRLNFESSKETCDLATQVITTNRTSNFGRQHEQELMRSSGKPKMGEIDVNHLQLSTGSINLQTDAAGIPVLKTEFAACPAKTGDAEIQGFDFPKVFGSHDGIGILDRSLSDIDLQAGESSMAEATVDNGIKKVQVAAECTCYKTIPLEMQAVNSLASNHTFGAVHQPVAFHFPPLCYAQCETSTQIRETDHTFTEQAAYCQVSPELTSNEFSLSGGEIIHKNINFGKKMATCSFTMPEIFRDADSQLTINGLQHDEFETSLRNYPLTPVYINDFTTKHISKNASCQVGTILLPEIMEVNTVPLKLISVVQSNRQEMPVDAVVCPTAIVVKPVLTESRGINVAKVQNLQHMSVKIGNQMYNASVVQTHCARTHKDLGHNERPICTLKMDVEKEWEDDYAIATAPNFSEAGFAIALNGSRRQQATENRSSAELTCHGQLETTCVNSALLETITSTRPLSAVSKSTQVDSSQCNSSTFEISSSVPEADSIQLKEIGEIDITNNLTEGFTSHTNVRNRVTTDADWPNSRVYQSDVVKANEGLAFGEASTVTGFKTIGSKMEEGCDLCHGTGKKVSAQVSFPDCKAKSTFDTAYQSVAYAKIQSSSVVNAECQVGAILRPTRVHVANVAIQPKTAYLAKQMKIAANAIICPSTVELQTELAEHTGIKVMDVNEVGDIELVSGTSLLQTSYRSSVANTPSIRPFMKNMNIMLSGSGLTLEKAQFPQMESSSTQSKKIFALHDVGCQFLIKNTKVETVSSQLFDNSQVENSMTALSPVRGILESDSRKPSFSYQRASTPISKTVECQVGVVLRPSRIQIGNIIVKPRDRQIAEHLGMHVDSVLCPARVQVVTELKETAGIEVLDVADATKIKIQTGEVMIDGEIRNRRPPLSSGSIETRRRSSPLLNIQGEQSGLTIGRSSPYASMRDMATTSEGFRLKDIGCEVVLQHSSIGGVCESCLGRTEATCVKSCSSQYSKLAPATMMTEAPHLKSKSSQVGVVLTPTSFNVAGVEIHPTSVTPAVSSGTIIYPAAVKIASKLTETSGIQMQEITTMESINVNAGANSQIASIKQISKPKGKVCVLEVKSLHPETVFSELSSNRLADGSLASTAKLNQQNIGWEFEIKDATSSAKNNLHDSINVAESEASMVGLSKNISSSQRKHASCQVGLMLIPTTVQVAGMSAKASEQRMASSLGLKADAVICPSTVDLETRLTDTAGVSVMDIKDVQEIGISVGGKKGLLSVTGTSVKAHEIGSTSRSTESAYITFTTSSPLNVQDVGPQYSKGHKNVTNRTSKPIDQNAGCTFQIRQVESHPDLSAEACTQMKPLKEILRNENVSCQVGVTMVPSKVHISKSTFMIEDKTSADAIGVSMPSQLRSTVSELKSRISDRSGISIAQINEVERVKLQVGSEVYNASVGGGGTDTKIGKSNAHWELKSSTSSIMGCPITSACVSSSLRRADMSISNTVGPYLVKMKEGAVEKQSILEVSGLTLGGKTLELKVDADLSAKLGQQSTGSYKLSSGRLGFRLPLPGRPDSRLCDVACEALIKPETLEKRLQATFI